MTDDVRVYMNGGYHDPEEFNGPSDEEISAAYKLRKKRNKSSLGHYARMADTNIQSSGNGTANSLRMVKHRGTAVEGVRVK